MADITNSTLDISIYEPGGGNGAGVNSSNELSVTDSTTHTTLTGIKDQTDKLTFTGSDLRVTTADSQSYQETNYLAGKGFVCTTNTVTISGTAEVALFYFTNPNASGKLCRITDLFLGLEKGASTVASEFRFYRDPTITANGTAITIRKALKSQSTSSVCSAYFSPTASANGSLMRCFAQSLGQTLYYADEMEIMIEANEKILITATPSVTGVNHAVTMTWLEV